LAKAGTRHWPEAVTAMGIRHRALASPAQLVLGLAGELV
jgi:hypothetical protein